MKNVILNDIQKQLAEELIKSVEKKERPVTYKELAERVTPKMNPRHVGRHVGEVSKVCSKLNLPLISAKVISSSNHKAGVGFYSLYNELKDDGVGLDESEIFKRELKRIRECQEWSKLRAYISDETVANLPKLDVGETDFDITKHTENRNFVAIANTDLSWFYMLKERNSSNEINFWTITPLNILKLKPGNKLFFMLESPIRKIGGYGYFKEYSDSSIQNAWETYGKGNGVESLNELIDKVNNFKTKNSTSIQKINSNQIGCIILNNPVFFDEENFFDPEEYGVEFPKNIDVELKYFDEDFFIKEKSLVSVIEDQENAFKLVIDESVEYVEQKSKKRCGQSDFRNRVLGAYRNKCAITGETCQELLQAAHIQPYINKFSNHIENGISLRIDIHKLFDEGLLSIDSDYKIIVHKSLLTGEYSKYNGLKIDLPINKKCHPSLKALSNHYEGIFRK